MGMKVLAARYEDDQEDVLWLMQDTGMCSESDLLSAASDVSLSAGMIWHPSQRPACVRPGMCKAPREPMTNVAPLPRLRT